MIALIEKRGDVQNAKKKIVFSKMFFAGDHVSFPGIGHLRADGSKYVWVPVNKLTY